MNNFNFYNDTNVLFGEGTVDKIADLIVPFSKKILIVYGKDSIKKSGLLDKVISILSNAGIEYLKLGGVDPNPRLSTVKKGAEICKENDIGFILAIGGGSTIDCAKGIGIASCYDGDVWDFYSYKKEPNKSIPLGTILTLSATGSEMNGNSVITKVDTEEKNGMGSRIMMPEFSILDPTLTYSVPKIHTAAGTIDIIAHCFEFYFNSVNTAHIQNSIAESIMKTCIKYGPIAINEPNNYEARANLMWASSLALMGVTSEGSEFDGTNHIVEHAVSAIYDLTHGVGLGIIMPHWLEEVLNDSTVAKIEQFAKNVWNVTEENSFDAAKEGIKRFKEFIISMGLPLKLSEVEISTDRFDDIVSKSLFGDLKSKVGLFNPLDKNGIMNLLIRAK